MGPRSRRLALSGLAAAALITGCHHFDPRPLSPEETARELEARTLVDPDVRDFIEGALGHRLDAWPPARWDRDLLTLAALSRHPDLAIARADLGVADAGITTAGARPNPTLSVAPEFVSNAASSMSPWIAAVHLDWPIETAGKRGHRLAEAGARAESARRGLDSAIWRVRGAVQGALAELAAADARASHLARESAIQDQRVRLLEAQRDAGAISSAAVASERLLAVQAAVDWADARLLREQARANLAAALGLPLRALDGIEVVPPEPAAGDGPEWASDGARRRALLGRSDVLAALAEYDASQAALQLEIARQYPDLHIGSGYQYDQGDDKWGLGVVVELPLLDRNEGPIEEAEARRTRAAARFEALQLQVIAEVDRASADRASALDQLARAEVLLGDQEELLVRARRALAAGSGDRAALLGAELARERGARLRDEARARLLDAEVRLEQAVQPPSALPCADWCTSSGQRP